MLTASIAPPAGSSGKVLIVEDDSTLRRAAVELFKALGYETLTAGDGISALRILEEQTDVGYIFSDVVMPRGMTGVELVEKARELRPGIKVLLASGYPFDKLDMPGSIDESCFISKPYRTAQLAEKMGGLKN